ncbi:hypothetical protein [Pantoea allii]|uniref:hypothetical protein n=1 Tax=Pantoea allii TaxID=574096 RepID=UPI003D7A7E05
MKLLKYLKLYLASKVNSDIIRSTTSSREFSNCISNLTEVNLVSLDGSLLRDVNHSLFEGIKRSGKEQDIIMREKWKENPSTYSRNIYDVVEPVINEALKKHKNLDARMRENTTYSVTLENPMGGHDQINITLFSSTDPVRESLRSGAFLHALTNNFPGMGMGISEEIFLKYISDFRASDGPGDHPLYTSLELLREESARLAKSKNQYSPYYALGV